jgi:hypothetical protein
MCVGGVVGIGFGRFLARWLENDVNPAVIGEPGRLFPCDHPFLWSLCVLQLKFLYMLLIELAGLAFRASFNFFGCDSLGNQIVLYKLRSSFAQCPVVFLGAPDIGVTHNHQLVVLIVLLVIFERVRRFRSILLRVFFFKRRLGVVQSKECIPMAGTATIEVSTQQSLAGVTRFWPEHSMPTS